MVAAEAMEEAAFVFDTMELPELKAHAEALAAERRGELPVWGRPKVVEKVSRKEKLKKQGAAAEERPGDAFKRPEFPDSNALREARAKALSREAFVPAVAYEKKVRLRVEAERKEQGKQDELKIALGQIRAMPLDILGPARRSGLTLDAGYVGDVERLDASALVRSASEAILGSVSRGATRAQVGVNLAAMQRANVPRTPALHEILRDDRPRRKFVVSAAGRPPARLYRARSSHRDDDEESRGSSRGDNDDNEGASSAMDDKTHDTMLDQIEGYKQINMKKLGVRGDVTKGQRIQSGRGHRNVARDPALSPAYKLADQIEAEWPRNGRNRYFKDLVRLIKEKPKPPAILNDWQNVGDRIEPDDAILARDYSLDPPHVDERFVPASGEPLEDVRGTTVRVHFALTEKKAKKMTNAERRRAILEATSNSRLLHSPIVLSKELYKVIPRWEAGRHYLQNRQRNAKVL